MAVVITFANQKGGVGKTTSAVTIGHGLALAGKRVLIIDLDTQGHVAYSLGNPGGNGLFRAIINEEPLKNVIIPNVREGLDILPSNKTTEAVKRYVTGMDFREQVLAKMIKSILSGYDAIILDTPPSLDVLHVAALVATNWVIIPTRLDTLALNGVSEVAKSMAEIETVHRFDGFSIVPTFFDRTTKETAYQLKSLIQTFGKNVWPPIPQDTKAREAPSYQSTLWEYCSKSPSIQGIEIDGKFHGGYDQILKRVVKEVL
ncbi:MAG: ParA family protein [Bacteroidales bacterium]